MGVSFQQIQNLLQNTGINFAAFDSEEKNAFSKMILQDYLESQIGFSKYKHSKSHNKLDESERVDQLVSKITTKLQNNQNFKEKEKLQTVVRNVVSKLDPHKSKMMFAISKVVKESRIKLKPRKTLSINSNNKENNMLKPPLKNKINTIHSIEEGINHQQSNEELFRIYSNEIFEKLDDIEDTPKFHDTVNISTNQGDIKFFPEENSIFKENDFPSMKTTKAIQPVEIGESIIPIIKKN